ncbi:MAG: hypothetical protein AVDCRST_MAG47-3189, partial [uncultured Nocardioidaceae bacterium]
PLLDPRHHGQPARAASRVGLERVGAGRRPRLRGAAVLERGRAVRPRRPAQRQDHALAVRRPQREGRRARHERRPGRRAHRRRPRLDPERLPDRADQPGQPPRRGRDHQPRRTRPGCRARLQPRVLDRGAAEGRPGAHRQPGDVVRTGPADRQHRLGQGSTVRDGPVAHGSRGRRAQRAAEPEGGRGPAGRHHRPVRARAGCRRGGLPRCRRRVPPQGVPDPLRHPAPGRGWPQRQPQRRLPPPAAGPRLLLHEGRRAGDAGPGRLHRRSVGPAAGRVPRRRLRLGRAGTWPAARRDVARLLRRRRVGGPRRAAAARRTRTLGDRLVQPLLPEPAGPV